MIDFCDFIWRGHDSESEWYRPEAKLGYTSSEYPLGGDTRENGPQQASPYHSLK